LTIALYSFSIIPQKWNKYRISLLAEITGKLEVTIKCNQKKAKNSREKKKGDRDGQHAQRDESPSGLPHLLYLWQPRRDGSQFRCLSKRDIGMVERIGHHGFGGQSISNGDHSGAEEGL
jgi:hypothetical protein